MMFTEEMLINSLIDWCKSCFPPVDEDQFELPLVGGCMHSVWRMVSTRIVDMELPLK
jgi:hypothetical protein